MEGEISKFKQTLKKSSQESESLSILVNKLEGEIDYLKRQISSMNDQKDKLKESYALYSKSLAQTEMDLAQIMQVKPNQKLFLFFLQGTASITTRSKRHPKSHSTNHHLHPKNRHTNQRAPTIPNNLRKRHVNHQETIPNPYTNSTQPRIHNRCRAK